MEDLNAINPSGGQSPISPDTDFNTENQSITKGDVSSGNISEADIQAFQGDMQASSSLANPAEANLQNQSIMDVARETALSQSSHLDIHQSSQSMNENFESLKGQARFFEDNPTATIPPETDSLLKGSINDFAASFQNLSGNVEGGPQLENPPPLGSPFKQFLSYFTGAQDKMNELTTSLNEEKDAMSPADLLSTQHKMHKMQQQVEFTTNVVNKVVEFIKQMQNIQL